MLNPVAFDAVKIHKDAQTRYKKFRELCNKYGINDNEDAYNKIIAIISNCNYIEKDEANILLEVLESWFCMSYTEDFYDSPL